MKDATSFRFPVDPEALKIPYYLQIIEHPMDFSTIERKLLASNPAKPDPNPANPHIAVQTNLLPMLAWPSVIV
jgi:bromodomain-containing factor 1